MCVGVCLWGGLGGGECAGTVDFAVCDAHLRTQCMRCAHMSKMEQSIDAMPDVETTNPIDPEYRRRQVRPEKGPPCTRDRFISFGKSRN